MPSPTPPTQEADPVHARLSRAGERLDQELARAARDYDQAGEALEGHAERLEREERGLQAKLAGKRQALEPAVLGDAPLPPDFRQESREYVRLLGELSQRKQARGLIRSRHDK